eukprot:CAMPEP_0168595692 /NCGR_PEP_ID=MMETSP0420-20121227/9611_1 /TAXON_ID=498008 /ORGANISM="Pessonella sp." /LENGTH=291 /DNA_ID=CAMNT_0008632183 /DNA_START=1 /DNA_END=872 /DNA_ORIENTATION=+
MGGPGMGGPGMGGPGMGGPGMGGPNMGGNMGMGNMGGPNMGGGMGMGGGSMNGNMGGGGGGGGPPAGIGPDCDLVEKIGNVIANRLHNMKASYKMFQDFCKLSTGYMQAMNQSSGCGRQMAAVLKKVSTGQGQPDIAEGFRNLAEMQHSTEQNISQVLTAFQQDLLQSAQNVLTGGFKETCRFEQGFLQGFQRNKQEIAQMPMSPPRQQKINEVEDKLVNNLEILKGLERKVYCNFLLLWTAVLDSQTSFYKEANQAYDKCQKQWTALAVSGDRIAPEPVDYRKILNERRG